MTKRFVVLLVLVGLTALHGLPVEQSVAQNTNEAVTSAPLPPPSSAPSSEPSSNASGNSSLAPPPAGVTLTLPDGGPTLIPGADTTVNAAPSPAPFRIGFLANSAPGDRQALLMPFRVHLEQSLNRPVEFIPFREARGLVVAMEQTSISYAIAPGSVLAATHALCSCVAPLGTQANADGSSGLFSVLIAPADGPVRHAEDIRADRLIIVGQGSVIAHQIGLSDLATQDVRFDRDQAFEFATSLTQAVEQVQAGQADAILSWTRQADGGVLFATPPAHQLDDDVRAGLRIVWRSRPVLGLSHYAHRDLGEVLLGQLRTILTQLAGTNGEAFYAVDQGSGRPFVATSITDYAPHMDALAHWSR